MRMEELSNSQYIKSTDTVERYLLGLVEQYFKHSNVAANTSREYIIKKAVERMREELSFENIGVLSITLPDGIVRTGAVSITLEDLDGEPAISPKNSAFNVSFGNEQNTACEGNDPRLSDKRVPLSHQHAINDIVGLEGILSTLSTKIDRVDGFLHEHDNLNVLDMLIYTGTKSKIDLVLLETIEDTVTTLVEGIQQDIIDYRTDVETEVAAINSKISEVREEIEDVRQYLLDTNKEYYELSKQYTDDKIDVTKTTIQEEIDKLVTKDMLDSIVAVANNTYTFAGSMEFNVSDVINTTGTNVRRSGAIKITDAIIDEIGTRGYTLENCQIEYFIEYADVTGTLLRGPLPYINCVDNVVDGSLQISIIYSTETLMITFDTAVGNVPDEIVEARIICKVYCPELVTL